MCGDHTTPQTAHSHSDIYDTQNCWKRRHHTITLRLPVKPRSHNPFISVIEGKSKCAAGRKIFFLTYCSATLSIARCKDTLFIPQCLTLTQLFNSTLLYQPRQARSTMRCLNLKREPIDRWGLFRNRAIPDGWRIKKKVGLWTFQSRTSKIII